MAFKTIEDLGDLTGKRALVRVDLNVPMQDGKVTDTTRLEATKDTIKAVQLAGGRVVLLAHFGRPKGERKPEMSLKAVVPALAEVLGQEVGFADHGEPLGDEAVIVLENTRYLPGEEKNDAAVAADFAKLGDVYINDAFSCAHRAHASTEALARLLPAAAGKTLEAELSALNAALGAPERPVVAVVGGAKVSSKIDVLTNLVDKVDHLIIGGGMANTFLFAQGYPVGKSLCEQDMKDTALNILERAKAANCAIHLPLDGLAAKEFKAGADYREVGLNDIADDEMILDAGPKTVEALAEVLKDAKTLVWNGPMGAFEIPPFDMATNGLAQQAGALTKAGSLRTVAGGGDTVAALAAAGVKDQFSHISTAGGAFLEWMEGRVLPGVAVLEG